MSAVAILVPISLAIADEPTKALADVLFHPATAPASGRPSPEPAADRGTTPARLPSGVPDTIAAAKAAMASCKTTYSRIDDYISTFYRREFVDGKLLPYQTLHMKARTRPLSFYFKFVKPTPGREAIYVAGGFGGKAVVHDVGLGKLLAGTLKLDPLGEMAMEDSRHPITEAGIGNMIDTIIEAWDKELRHGESRVIFHHKAKVGDRTCLMIESIHPVKQPGFLFYAVKVYIDEELNLPIRFEAYDWPRNGRPPALIEEYTYANLELNVGLTERDFDPSNPSYSFGRF